MQRSPIVLGMAAVFAGLTAVLCVVALATRELFVLFVAAPFAVTSYFMYQHATGKLAEFMRQGRGFRTESSGGFGAGARRTGGRSRFAREARERARRGDAAYGGARVRPPGASSGPTREEAARVLGVAPDADEETVRRAYRRRVKEVHPDADGGDEDRFKRVRAAYETLRES